MDQEEMLTEFLKKLTLNNYKDAVKNRVDIAALIQQSFPQELAQARLTAFEYKDKISKLTISEVMNLFTPDVYYYFKSDKTAMKWLDITIKNIKKLV